MSLANHKPGYNTQIARRNSAASGPHVDQTLLIGDIEQRLLDGDSAMKQLREDLAINTAETKKVAGSTAEIVEFFESMKGAFKVLNWIGALAKPIGAIVLMCTSCWGAWTLWKTGVPPK